MPVAWGGDVVAVPLGATDGGAKSYDGASPPGRDTSSGRKFPAESARRRPSKSVHLTLCHLYIACQKTSLNSVYIRHRRVEGKAGFWHA